MLRVAGLDAERAFAEFRANSGSEDLDQFVAGLLREGRISSGVFLEIHAGEEVQVTNVFDLGNGSILAEAARLSELVPASKPPTTDLVRPTDGETHSPRGPARYSMLGSIGRGGMGEVQVARDEELLRKVAYKRMRPDAAMRKVMVARFFSEAQVTAQLDHPHIVPIYGLEIDREGALGYSMKLVQGKTFREIIDEELAAGTRIDRREAVRRYTQRLELFLKVCDGIAFAHGKGVLHRDLKPENVMVGRYNEVYVMDWGLCRIIGATDGAAEPVAATPPGAIAVEQRTEFGTMVGTPAYMSPEQAEGRNADLDGRSDLFSLGLVLFELLTLRRAIKGDTIKQILRNIREAKLDLVHVNPEVKIPRELRAIVAKATASDRERRYPSVSAFAEDIRRYLRGEAVLAEPDNFVRAAARWVSRHRTAALGIIGALVLVSAFGVIGLLVHERVALARARLHEERMQSLLTAIEERAHAIDEEFFRDEQLLNGLAGHVSELLLHGASPPDAEVYLNREFAKGRYPPDLKESAYYGVPVSLDFPVFQIAPGVDPAAVRDELRRLSLLTPTFRSLMAESAGGVDLSIAADRERLLANGAPILRAFVTLPNGVHCVYPGIFGFEPDYDGRTRPKYLLAADQHGIRWGEAYSDQFGHGLLLPSSVAVYDSAGRLVAVTGMSTTFEFIERHLLKLADQHSVDEADLVDEKGRVVVSWRRDGISQLVPPGREEQAISLAMLGIPSVRAAILAGEIGKREIGVGAAKKVVGFYRLQSLGWYYVATADAGRLFARGE